MRICLGLPALAPLLGLPAFALLNGLIWSGSMGEPHVYEIARAFEVVLPLAAGLAAAHLMSIEAEEGFDDLRRSYPEAAWRLPLARSLFALGLGLAALALGTGAFRLAAGPFPIGEAVLPALPPALFLSGLSLLAGSLARNYWAAGGAVMAYWFFELQSRGQATGLLYLFQTTLPQESLLQPFPYDLNRGLLAASGLLFILLAAGWSVHRKIPIWRSMRSAAE